VLRITAPLLALHLMRTGAAGVIRRLLLHHGAKSPPAGRGCWAIISVPMATAIADGRPHARREYLDETGAPLRARAGRCECHLQVGSWPTGHRLRRRRRWCCGTAPGGIRRGARRRVVLAGTACGDTRTLPRGGVACRSARRRAAAAAAANPERAMPTTRSVSRESGWWPCAASMAKAAVTATSRNIQK